MLFAKPLHLTVEEAGLSEVNILYNTAQVFVCFLLFHLFVAIFMRITT
jgi:hypothetical protein